MKCERGKEARTLASREHRAKQVEEDGLLVETLSSFFGWEKAMRSSFIEEMLE